MIIRTISLVECRLPGLNHSVALTDDYYSTDYRSGKCFGIRYSAFFPS